MSKREIVAAIMELPEGERLELARQIVSDTLIDPTVSDRVAQAVKGIEDMATGKIQGLTEEEYNQAVKE
jgi:hypothetical protein